METSELIKQVKLRPAIWSATHRDNKKMAAAWQQICKLAWPGFNTRSLEEKRTKFKKHRTGLELQKKWKGLQQSFTRDHVLQKQAKGRGVQKSQYYDQLSFLAPTIDIKCTTPGSSNSTENATSSTAETSTLDVTPSPGPSKPSALATPTPQELDAEEDRQFLLSLVSFMQEVPRSSKLALRSEIIQVIAKYIGSDSLPDRAPALSQEY